MKSSRFELVKYYYENKLWNKGMVRAAVGRWITAEECAELLQEKPAAEPPAPSMENRLSDVEEAINGIIRKEPVRDAG